MIYRALFKNPSIQNWQEAVHALGKELLAYGLFKEKGIIYNQESIIKNLYGKPSLRNFPFLHYNISHSENYVVCIISDSRAVGIDVEKIRGFNPYAAKKVCSLKELNNIYSKRDSDKEFFRLWTLKESYIKAIGLGLSFPMKNVNFHIDKNGGIRCNMLECEFKLIEDDEFIIAVCYINKAERE
jgi:4'-phosphopantetheinyl transferase